MRTSELIEKLEEMLKEHGDLDCCYHDDCINVTIDEVRYNQTWNDIDLL